MKKKKFKYVIVLTLILTPLFGNAQYYRHKNPKEIIDRSDEFNMGDKETPKCSLSVFKGKSEKENDKLEDKDKFGDDSGVSKKTKKTKNKIICVDPNKRYYEYNYNKSYNSQYEDNSDDSEE